MKPIRYITGVVVAASAGLGLAACGGASHSAHAATRPFYYRDVPGQMVVENIVPGLTQAPIWHDPAGNAVQPQTSRPNTGRFDPVCEYKWSDGVRWIVWDTSSSTSESVISQSLCKSVGSEPGAQAVRGPNVGTNHASSNTTPNGSASTGDSAGEFFTEGLPFSSNPEVIDGHNVGPQTQNNSAYSAGQQVSVGGSFRHIEAGCYQAAKSKGKFAQSFFLGCRMHNDGGY